MREAGVSEAHENVRLLWERIVTQPEAQTRIESLSGAVIARLVVGASACIEQEMQRPISFHDMYNAALAVVLRCR